MSAGEAPGSRKFRGWAAVVLSGLLLIGACRTPAPAPIEERSADAYRLPAPGSSLQVPSQYVVREGDTLYAIAWRFGLDYRLVADWNGIGPPFLIRPGDRLQLRPSATAPAPAAAGATAQPPARTAPARPTPRPIAPQPADQAPTVVASPPEPEPSPPAPSAQMHWQWPTAGEMIGRFAAGSQGGIDIAGQLGQPIVAAADGEVVYSGAGLVGYGELIIIKHDEQFLSAYAHNRRRLVSEGEQVVKGSKIAEMGDTGTNRAKLHFEIRKEGKPVNPERYLPARD